MLDIARLHGDTPVVQWLVKVRRQGHGPERARSESPAGEYHPKRDPGKSSADSAGGRKFRSEGGLRFLPQQQLRGDGGRLGPQSRIPGGRKDRGAAGQSQRVRSRKNCATTCTRVSSLPVGDFFGPFVVSYMLIGLDAEHYQPDLNTDAVAMYLKSRQSPDGQWPYPAADTRPPICSDYIGQTALSMRALQLYAPKTDKAAYDQSIQLAAAWIANAQSTNNEDRTYRLLGLAWAGKDKDATQKAMRELLAKQRADGGWSDLDSMESGAYATGKRWSLCRPRDCPHPMPPIERAVQFLLNTQQEDGSWYVKTRAMAFQPYFDAGFPHGFDQWISAAGTSWATMALSLAAPTESSETSGKQ